MFQPTLNTHTGESDVNVHSTDVFGYYAMHFNNLSMALLAIVNTKVGVTHCNYDDNRMRGVEESEI